MARPAYFDTDRRAFVWLLLESQRLWETFSQTEGCDLGFKRAGILFVFDTPRMRAS